MVEYYGEWEQRPDYTYPADLPADGADETRASPLQELSVTPDEPYDHGRFEPLASAALAPGNFTGSDLGGDARLGHGAVLTGGFSRTGILDRSDYEAQAANWLTWRHGYTGLGRAPAPALPEGAVGVQYEGIPSVIGATAVLRAKHWLEEFIGGSWAGIVYAFQPGSYLNINAATPPIYTSWDAAAAMTAAITGYDAFNNPILDPAVAQPVTEFAGPQPHGTIQTQTVDLTPYLFGQTGAVALLDWLRVSEIPSLPPDDISIRGSCAVELVTSDTLVRGIEVTYTYRPARHRFVYERKPELPIQRVHPRNDGRGTASAARVYPPPTSQQGSARVGPGSYY